MEWNNRIAASRRAAGLTQEQLGELVGVTRQAVSKWESGQTVPDALTMAKLCQALHVSADYILLGTQGEPAGSLPDSCPCCGREVSGTICPICGYTLPTTPPRGPRYAIIDLTDSPFKEDARAAAVEKYCGLSPEYAQMLTEQNRAYGSQIVLRRDLSDSAAQYMAVHLLAAGFHLRIVQDEGEPDEDLAAKPQAMELPAPKREPLGFWGVVGAIIVALLLLSLF